MVYLLGGPMRVGKSLIARRAAALIGASTLPTDDVRAMLGEGAPHLGVHVDMDPLARCALIWPFLHGLIAARVRRDDALILEGDALCPSDAARVRDEFPGCVRVCFAGELAIDREEKLRNMRSHTEQHGGWLADASPEDYAWVVDRIFEISRKQEAECAALGIQYFDVGTDFEESVERAARYLAGRLG